MRVAYPGGEEFLLERRCLKCLAVRVEFGHLLRRAMEGLTLFEEGTRLSIDVVIVYGVGVGIVHAGDVEDEPTTIACGVGEDVEVVASATQRGVMLEFGIVAVVEHADAGHAVGSDGLQLDVVPIGEAVELLEADDDVASQADDLFLLLERVAYFLAEVTMQVWRQQALEEGRLADTLIAEEHEDVLVDVVRQDASHKANHPLTEVAGEKVAFSRRPHALRQQADVVWVSVGVPVAALPEVVGHGVIALREGAVECRPQPVHALRREARLRHVVVEGVDDDVADIAITLCVPLQFVVGDAAVVGGLEADGARHDVAEELALRTEVGFDLLGVGIEARTSCGLLLSRTAGVELVDAAVTGMDDGSGRLIVGKAACGPINGLRLGHAPSVTFVAHQTDEVVVMARLIHLALLEQPVDDLLEDVLDVDGHEAGMGIEVGVSVMAEVRQPRVVARLRIVGDAGEALVVLVARLEDVAVGGARLVGVVDAVAVEDAQALARCGGVAEEGEGVGLDLLLHLGQPVVGYVVEVHEGYARVPRDVTCAVAAVTLHGRREGSRGPFVAVGVTVVATQPVVARTGCIFGHRGVGGDAPIDGLPTDRLRALVTQRGEIRGLEITFDV